MEEGGRGEERPERMILSRSGIIKETTNDKICGVSYLIANKFMTDETKENQSKHISTEEKMDEPGGLLKFNFRIHRHNSKHRLWGPFSTLTLLLLDSSLKEGCDRGSDFFILHDTINRNWSQRVSLFFFPFFSLNVSASNLFPVLFSYLFQYVGIAASSEEKGPFKSLPVLGSPTRPHFNHT